LALPQWLPLELSTEQLETETAMELQVLKTETMEGLLKTAMAKPRHLWVTATHMAMAMEQVMRIRRQLATAMEYLLETDMATAMERKAMKGKLGTKLSTMMAKPQSMEIATRSAMAKTQSMEMPTHRQR
jgi:hypothetical protein